METFKRVAAVLGLIVFIIFVMAAMKLPDVEVKKYKLDYEVQNPEEKILKYQDKFLADRALLKDISFFRGSKGTADAGPYLNPLLTTLAISKDLQRELQNRNWVAFEPDFKKLALDFSWMKELHKYDYWAPDFNNPAIDPKKHPNISSLPLPEYSHLISWARLRLMHGRQTRDMKNALADVRQLARLIYTNDYLVSSMVAITILGSEGKYLQNYNPKIWEGWKIIPQETLEAARRYHWGIAEVVDPRISDETYERLTGGNVGKCQMISEGMLKNLIVRDELAKVYPREVQRFGETVKNSLEICRKSIVHLMWEDPTWKVLGEHIDYAESFVKPENDNNWKWKFLMILPRMREIYAYWTLSVATPDYFRQYEEKGREKKEE
ncbi:MAG: hypothetical protein ACJ76H_09485 [Bacteriovoracaceae bacterium]